MRVALDRRCPLRICAVEGRRVTAASLTLAGARGCVGHRTVASRAPRDNRCDRERTTAVSGRLSGGPSRAVRITISCLLTLRKCTRTVWRNKGAG